MIYLWYLNCSCLYYLQMARIFSAMHYGDVMMGAIASQITSLTIVYSTVYSYADQRKHQSSASLAFVRGIHWGPVNSPHKWPVTRKMFPFDDVIMNGPNLNDLIEVISGELRLVYKWVKLNKLSLNIEKTKVMLFIPKNFSYLKVSVVVDNHPIKEVHYTKFLDDIIERTHWLHQQENC